MEILQLNQLNLLLVTQVGSRHKKERKGNENVKLQNAQLRVLMVKVRNTENYQNQIQRPQVVQYWGQMIKIKRTQRKEKVKVQVLKM